MKAGELKKELESHGLDTLGKKPELIAILKEEGSLMQGLMVIRKSSRARRSSRSKRWAVWLRSQRL